MYMIKMASVEVVISNGSSHSERFPCVSEEILCANCLTMKDYVQVLTTELKSAQLIIDILQDERKSNTIERTSAVYPPTCVNSDEWKLVSNNKNRVKRKTPTQQSQPQPIPIILNRYTTFDNLIQHNLNHQSQTHQQREHTNNILPPKDISGKKTEWKCNTTIKQKRYR